MSSPTPPPVSIDRLQEQIALRQGQADLDVSGRRDALSKLESAGGTAAVFYYSPDQPLTRTDVSPFQQMLSKVGKVDALDVIVISPGGDGTAAETIVDLCRKYCRNELRVVIPAFAKSAATLIALSADKIVMGEGSELGPIDAQITVMQDGCPQQISADHVIRAAARAQKDLRHTDPSAVQAAQIRLSTMSAPFVEFCRDAMDFARDFAKKQLVRHMFENEHAANTSMWDTRVNDIVTNLTASKKHLTHGRMITAEDIAADSELKHLKIDNLPTDDPYWQALLELKLRTDIIAGSAKLSKILFSRNFQMMAGA